jgi:hypothetical protein
MGKNVWQKYLILVIATVQKQPYLCIRKFSDLRHIQKI